MSRHPLRPAQLRQALESLEPGLGSLEAASRLRKSLDVEATRRVVELHQLRQRASPKLGDARGLWLSRKGLEQATGRQVADWRARRIASWASSQPTQPWVLDGTAGIGGDSLALQRAGLGRLVANELDPDTAVLLRTNLLQNVPTARVICSRIESGGIAAQALLLDPDRRSPEAGPQGASGPRSGSPQEWSPAWEACGALIRRYENTCIKLAPAVDVERLELPAGIPRAWQWISLGGELKEVTLWTGPWAAASDLPPDLRLGCGERERTVTLLGRDGKLRAHWSATPEPRAPLDPQAARAVRWIAEPDASVIRAGLVGALGVEQGLAPLARDCVYLGGAGPVHSGLMKSFEVLDHCALDKKKLKAMLATHDVGPLVVKKRGHAASAEELAKRFAGRGSTRGLLIVARLGEAHHAYLVRQASLEK